MTRDLLTVAASARKLGISRTTLYRWIEEGKIAVVYIGPNRLPRLPRTVVQAQIKARIYLTNQPE
jgi:excisionase family DNA binding protein